MIEANGDEVTDLGFLNCSSSIQLSWMNEGVDEFLRKSVGRWSKRIMNGYMNIYREQDADGRVITQEDIPLEILLCVSLLDKMGYKIGIFFLIFKKGELEILLDPQ